MKVIKAISIHYFGKINQQEKQNFQFKRKKCHKIIINKCDLP